MKNFARKRAGGYINLDCKQFQNDFKPFSTSSVQNEIFFQKYSSTFLITFYHEKTVFDFCCCLYDVGSERPAAGRADAAGWPDARSFPENERIYDQDSDGKK
ncbi:MAG: hypothetical protein IJS25_06550 [Bacteroidales bacterium]|nr:hypothetical protein [Bacteroidales bacterium]